ncbi:hypothetical protein CCACVL1_27047 [Corchorus capsularis]|uniref:F-box domain-containing protein n=1 Tax=Corchorus capsularis TaxID=210143 RepID=A0A1R3GCC1_COCAP|nr:hypothetical protein CCACVL1_27047 [Corchorus capsularis]
MDIGVPELPEELLTLIGKNLQTRFDIIRFRSVCRRWRYSLPCCLSNSHGPLKKDHNPHSDSESSLKAKRYTSLHRSAVYILNQYPVPCPIPTPWLLGLEETKEVYRGRFVAVDRCGTVSIVDFSSKPKVTKYTPPIFNGGSKKHLAVFCEHLYLVDRYLDRARTTQNPYEKVYAKVVAFKVHKFDEEWGWKGVTSLDDKMLFIGKWLNFFVPTKELSGCKGNCIYFIDEKRTWYDDEDKASVGSTGDGMAVFSLEDGKIGKLSSFSGYSDMFWPPPTCFTANQNPS